MRSVLLAIAFALTVVALTAQTPTFKAPPGYQTKVEAIHKTYNFYPITRTLDLPWNRLKLAESRIPAGNSESSNLRSPSADALRLYNDPKKVFPSFGAPEKQMFQAYRGKDGDGIIMYFRYANVLPADAKERLSRLFFGTATPPDPTSSPHIEQFLVNDHTIIVWSFKNLKSAVKEAHQEYIFNLVSEVATAAQKQK